MEASGTVREIGSNVTKFNIGDKVTHCMNLGSFSQFMNLDQDKTIKLKKEVDLKIAAASTLQGLTSQYLINHSYKLKEHDTVLVHAAAGGVGQILCQWAKKIGANYIAFGAFFKSSTKKTKYNANLALLRWSKKKINIPFFAF